MNEFRLVEYQGKWYAESREIAEMTGKEHKNIIRDIETYIHSLESSDLSDGVIPHVSEFFIPGEYMAGSPPRRYKQYLLTRKGCDMVANKMTGEKGVLFTAAYVTRFEEMEKKLTAPIPKSREEIIQAGYIALQELVEEMRPKAEYFDALVDRKLNTNFRDTAKELHVKESDFIKFLEAKKYIYRDQGGKIKPYAQHVPGIFELKEFAANTGHAGIQTLITPRGRETFRILLGN
jgi:Rha family phage regulatory protein